MTPSSHLEFTLDSHSPSSHTFSSSFKQKLHQKKKSRLHSTCLLLLALSSPFFFTFANAEPTTIPRRGHTATLLNNTVYFVGGIGAASATDIALITPLKSISALDLKTLDFTETPTTLTVYGHGASSTKIISKSKVHDFHIGISFGQSSANESSDPLQWLDPVTGSVSVDNQNGMGASTLTRRIGHSFVQFGNNLWDFGGYIFPGTTPGASAKPTTVPDTPTFSIRDSAWSTQTNNFNRYGHASAPAGLDNIVSCYGVSIGASSADDCVYFSASSKTFASASITWKNDADKITGGLVGHTIVTGTVNSNILYMFGGSNTAGTILYHDVYRLNTTYLPSIVIEKIVPTSDTSASIIPSPRIGHAAVSVGTQIGVMIIQGGRVSPSNSTRVTLADSAPYFFSMDKDMWIDGEAFKLSYTTQNPDSSVSVVVIILGILASVMILGAGVAYYIWKGITEDEIERLKKQEEEAGSPTLSTIDGRGGDSERKTNSVYPLGDESVSMSNGPFKSTTSLIQSEESGKKKSNKKKGNRDFEPHSPGGTTLTENGSVNGYYSSSASSSAPKLNKNNSNGSSQYSRQGRGNSSTPTSGAEEPNAAGESYYNTRDLYLDDDDDSSLSTSYASESTMSQWGGGQLDLAPPNPRFSRGAISNAHRQLVGTISTHNFAGNRYSNGWDTSSPGGSISSDGDYNRRSVNSMQWVSFDPMDLSAGRPDSGQFEPLSYKPLTVRNYNRGSVVQPNPRMSMFGGSNTSDTNTEDSGSYYSGPGGKRISTALAARQQRRSMRYSQESQGSMSNKGQTQIDGSTNGASSEDPMVTKVLPVITTKITKPTMAKVVNNPHNRGSRTVVMSGGVASNEKSGNGAMSDDGDSSGGLGIDFSRFGESGTSNRTSINGMPYQGRRGSSTLNPNYIKPGAGKRESKLASSYTQHE
ncbi:hypothetical protein BGZ76_008878 [Entomortierella beljakovae]|nr:hypothetical protein BGZ76_008878 [Entomortierella beljakovae]